MPLAIQTSEQLHQSNVNLIVCPINNGAHNLKHLDCETGRSAVCGGVGILLWPTISCQGEVVML